MRDEVIIDGAEGEGGGQVLRSSLALSIITGRPFTLENVRARRAKPGLQRQHLTAVRAAAEVSGARVEGDAVGSSRVRFEPGPVRAGDYVFRIGTAGSATLVLQTVLPALLTADGPSTVTLEGGTHNPMAPPFEFIDRVFLPWVNRMGAHVTATLDRSGFYPAGGGRFRVSITPFATRERVEVTTRGALVERRVVARVAGLPWAIAEREVRAANELLGWAYDRLSPEVLPKDQGPGNVVMVEVGFEHTRELFVAVGERGVPAETVAERVAREALAWLEAEVPVGEHLADQLLVPMALVGGGRFVTVAPSAHTVTNAQVIGRFLPVQIESRQLSERAWEVTVRS
jgi:RNA 3'-terminal phosphate cyclase (ATP)